MSPMCRSWPIAGGDRTESRASIIDLAGLSFVPLYRFLGPVSMIVILVLFFVGLSRLVFTILFRAIVLGRHRGVWVLDLCRHPRLRVSASHLPHSMG
jgi:hypothetical protein